MLWPTELKRQAGELTPSHRSTRYPCFGQDLGDLRGAGREGLTRCKITTFFSIHQIFSLHSLDSQMIHKCVIGVDVHVFILGKIADSERMFPFLKR